MYRTLDQRKREEADRRGRAVAAICERLASFASAKGGRFILYGSAAKDQMRFDSDIDLLIDFPEDCEAEAWRLAEGLGAEYAIPLDIKPLAWCEPSFRERIMPTARILA